MSFSTLISKIMGGRFLGAGGGEEVMVAGFSSACADRPAVGGAEGLAPSVSEGEDPAVSPVSEPKEEVTGCPPACVGRSAGGAEGLAPSVCEGLAPSASEGEGWEAREKILGCLPPEEKKKERKKEERTRIKTEAMIKRLRVKRCLSVKAREL